MNEEKANWKDVVRHMESLLRLKTFPVAFKLLEDPGELAKNRWLRRPEKKATLCQLITLVRVFDWTVGATAEDFVLPACPNIIGLTGEMPEQVRDGTFRSLVWCRTREDGKKFEDSIPRIPAGRFKAVMLAPLAYEPFQPDMVLIYGNAAQMILVVNALQFDDYERLQFFCVGESSCSDAIAQCYLTGKPSLTIPCWGERRYAEVQDDELVIALRPEQVRKVERNLIELYQRGVCYPIPHHGAQVDPLPGMPPSYQKLARGEKFEGLGFPPRKVTRW
ncbi:MAG: DUF169 domain-containing protein [Chloroflexota bacterium]